MSLNLKEIQTLQEKYDSELFDLNTAPDFEKIRHICLHISCTLGKLSRFCEKKEHVLFKNRPGDTAPLENKVSEEIIPDLLIHSAQLANILGDNLEELFKNRMASNLERFKKKE